MKTPLTPNFCLEELCYSATAAKQHIANTPTTQAICNLAAVAHKILQPLREWWGKPINIGSGYRSTLLNKAVGGVANSQHLLGEAVDICIDGDKAKGKKWFDYIEQNLPFDQLIWEHNPKTGSYWIHVSFRADGNNRHKVVRLLIK